MRTYLSLAVLLLTVPAAYAQQQQFNPPHLLIRTLCQGGNGCADVSAQVSRTVPYTGTKSVEGALKVAGDDPIATCIQRLDKWKDVDVDGCIKEHLSSQAVRDELKKQQFDGYLVYVLHWDPRGGSVGRAVLLTPGGERVNSSAAINAYRSDLTPLGIAYIPPQEQALVVMLPELGPAAARAGLQGFPAHHEVAHPDGGEAKLFGALFVPPGSN